MPLEQYVNDSAHHGLAMDEAGHHAVRGRHDGRLRRAGRPRDRRADVSSTRRPPATSYGKPYWSTEGLDDTCWISLSETDSVAVLDFETKEELAYLPVGDHPQRVRHGVVPGDGRRDLVTVRLRPCDIAHSRHPLIEEILDAHADRARGDEAGFAGYRGHVYRVFNLARGLVDDADDRDDKLAIAAAFHDIEAFAGLDYLAPSITAQDAWLERPAGVRGRRSSRSWSRSTTDSGPTEDGTPGWPRRCAGPISPTSARD